MSETTDNSQAGGRCAPAPGSVSREEVQRILDNTDWEAFWQRVHEACAPEIEAYRRASVLSLQNNHVYL
jgi:hypothetical protein